MRKRNYLGVLLALALVASYGTAQAQLGPPSLNAANVNDPCALYPHLSASLPVPGAAVSPTALLIAGVANLRTFICGYQFSMSGASPTLLMGFGQAAASTPCATGTTLANAQGYYKGTLAEFGGPGAGDLGGAGNAFVASETFNSTIFGPVPAVATATTLPWDICITTCPGVGCTTGNVSGSVTYVQAP